MRMKMVLIIDDEQDFLDMVKIHLEAISDFQVYTASDGKTGIAVAKKIKPDIIILDILMPLMDGFQVLEKIKKDADTLDIPVIMLSAAYGDKAKIKAAGLYAENYITKPVDINALKAKIEEVFKWRGEK